MYYDVTPSSSLYDFALELAVFVVNDCRQLYCDLSLWTKPASFLVLYVPDLMEPSKTDDMSVHIQHTGMRYVR